MSACETCDGKGWVWDGAPGNDGNQDPCPTCRVVVSREDAEVAKAVREIEADGAVLGHDPNLPMGVGPWVVWKPGQPKVEVAAQHGKTLRAALAAYRAAAKGGGK